MLTRITIFLTLVSAGLVTIGLLGQASGFSDWFGGASLAILAFLAAIGLMTQTRVLNVAEEDMMYVVAMNRLRSAYVDLDPQVAEYFLSSIHDDRKGMELTYSYLRPRSVSVLAGSSFILIIVVTACVFGLLTGAIVAFSGGALGCGDRRRHRRGRGVLRRHGLVWESDVLQRMATLRAATPDARAAAVLAAVRGDGTQRSARHP